MGLSERVKNSPLFKKLQFCANLPKFAAYSAALADHLCKFAEK
jgi:hypothetical protein